MGKRLRGKLIMISLLAVMAPAVADAEDASLSKPSTPTTEVTIPFANRGGISDWRRVDDSTLLIEDVHGHWYLAKLQVAAYDLAFSDSVGFVTPPTGELGKLSSVVVSGRRYPIVSLTRAAPPPRTRTEPPAKEINPY